MNAFIVVAPCIALFLLTVTLELRGPARGRPGRVMAAIVVACMLAVLGLRPTMPAPGVRTLVIASGNPDERTFANVEARLLSLAGGSDVTVRGDGLDSATRDLLAGFRVRWTEPATPAGLTALEWSHRAMVGDRVTVTGRRDDTNRLPVVIVHPDGRRDSVPASDSFFVPVTLRAAGPWSWVLEHPGGRDTIGIDVHDAPRPAFLMVEARPSGEGSALGRVIQAQRGWMLQRTRVTAGEDRVVRHGPAPTNGSITTTLLDSLDAVILGPGGVDVLTSGERSALVGAVREGLGVLHLVDSTMPKSTLQPFEVSRGRDNQRLRVAIDASLASVTMIPVAPVSVSGGDVLLSAPTGEPLAWRKAEGLGIIAATRVTLPSRLGLAGEPAIEGAWWATLLGAVMRPPPSEWRVTNTSLARVDQPLVVERIGAQQDTFLIRDGALPPESIVPAATSDSSRTMFTLWPVHTGWLRVIDGADTLAIHVGSREAHPSIDQAMRRRVMQRAATAVAATSAGVQPTSPARQPVPLWWAWAALLGACTMLWRRR